MESLPRSCGSFIGLRKVRVLWLWANREQVAVVDPKISLCVMSTSLQRTNKNWLWTRCGECRSVVAEKPRDVISLNAMMSKGYETCVASIWDHFLKISNSLRFKLMVKKTTVHRLITRRRKSLDFRKCRVRKVFNPCNVTLSHPRDT